MSQPPKHIKTMAVTESGSPLAAYQNLMVGSTSLGATAYYEFCMLMGPIPGALGFVLRKVFWPRMFKQCGRGVQFGQGVIVRHPNRISIGDNTLISEFSILDGRNLNRDEAIHIGSKVVLANFACLQAKGGHITVGDRTGIGSHTVVQSTHNNPVTIGADNAIAPHCYIIGGSDYNIDRLDVPMWTQGIKLDGGVHLADDIWLGANVTILSNVTMASGSVAAAGALVNKDVEKNTIVGGVPAKAIKVRS